MDSHFEAVPGVGALSAGRLARGDTEGLGGHSDWALDAKILVLCAANEIGADLLERLDVARREGDADPLLLGLRLVAGFLESCHFCW